MKIAQSSNTCFAYRKFLVQAFVHLIKRNSGSKNSEKICQRNWKSYCQAKLAVMGQMNPLSVFFLNL